jgi:hypothetical protein
MPLSVLRPLSSVLRTCLLLALAPALGRAAEAVVVLPAFEVRDTRPWLFAEAPGMQILSLASERETREFAQRLQDVSWLTPLLLPPGVDGAITAPGSLFLRHFAGDKIAARLGVGVGFSAFAFSIFWQDISISFPTDAASRDWSVGREYVNLDFMRVTGLATPRVPIWYRDGMGELLRTATGSTREVVVPGRTWKQPLNPSDAIRNAALNPYASVDPPRMGLRELLEVRPAGYTMNYREKAAGDRQRYLRGASLFVHWGFFGQAGRHREVFLRFVAEAMKHPPDEPMVKQILGFSLEDLQERLDRYAEAVPRQRIAAPADLLLPPAAVVRPATLGEMARIVGEAYGRLAESSNVMPQAARTYRDNAREVLEGALDAGEGDPAVFLQLGLLAQSNLREDDAIAWLQRAVDGGVRRPSAYLALAGLRLNRLSAETLGTKLSAPDTAAMWNLLRQADDLRPRLPDVYRLAVAMWQNSSVRPEPEDLVRIAAGVDAFPDEVPLMRDALRFFIKLGVEANPALTPSMAAWRTRLGFTILTL